jgi:hypothetical protein
MGNGNLLRLGGLCGLLCVVVMIPAYLVGTPDAPATAAEAGSYFGSPLGTFVLANGVLPIFHVFFFLFFLGALRGLLARAEGEAGALASVALAGGAVFAALTSAGFAAEVLYPAAAMRFGAFEPDAAFVYASLALSSWLYHFCQVGTSAMVAAASLISLGTGALPRWLALAGFVVALVTLLHFLVPLLAALVGLLWIAAVSALMLAGGVGRAGGVRRTRPAAR